MPASQTARLELPSRSGWCSEDTARTRRNILWRLSSLRAPIRRNGASGCRRPERIQLHVCLTQLRLLDGVRPMCAQPWAGVGPTDSCSGRARRVVTLVMLFDCRQPLADLAAAAQSQGRGKQCAVPCCAITAPALVRARASRAYPIERRIPPAAIVSRFSWDVVDNAFFSAAASLCGQQRGVQR